MRKMKRNEKWKEKENEGGIKRYNQCKRMRLR
jgi:hypothetical protein